MQIYELRNVDLHKFIFTSVIPMIYLFTMAAHYKIPALGHVEFKLLGHHWNGGDALGIQSYLFFFFFLYQILSCVPQTLGEVIDPQ
jgi:hypothetical protein